MSVSYRATVAALQSRVESRALPVSERERLAVARVALVARMAGNCNVCAGFVGRPVGSVTVAHLLREHGAEYAAL